MDKKIETTTSLKEIESFLNEKKSILQFIPRRLKSIIGDDKYILYEDKKIKTSYLVDFMHMIIMKCNHSKKLYFNLSSLILRDKYGSKSTYYTKWLVENGFISIKSNYYVGKKAKTFKISSDILVDCSRYINRDRTILKKYRNNLLSSYIDNTNYNWIDNDIKEKIVRDLFYIDIDIDKSAEILSTLDKQSFTKNDFSVDSIEKKDIYCHFDRYGRVHTNFTTLKSDIRKKCLLIDGEEVEEIDIRNSQPLFLTILINKYNGLSDSLMDCVDDGEFKFFKELVTNGEFYNYYMEQTGIRNRKEAKTTIYKVLFGKNLDDDENYMFRELFPTIHNFILVYKDHFGDYKSLAYELQRSESNFLFNSIIKEIMVKYPHIKLFTVHDSISYSKKYTKEVSDIFNTNIGLLFR